MIKEVMLSLPIVVISNIYIATLDISARMHIVVFSWQMWHARQPSHAAVIVAAALILKFRDSLGLLVSDSRTARQIFYGLRPAELLKFLVILCIQGLLAANPCRCLN